MCFIGVLSKKKLLPRFCDYNNSMIMRKLDDTLFDFFLFEKIKADNMLSSRDGTKKGPS